MPIEYENSNPLDYYRPLLMEKGPLVISMKISPRRVEKYFIFSTLLAGTKIMSK